MLYIINLLQFFFSRKVLWLDSIRRLCGVWSPYIVCENHFEDRQIVTEIKDNKICKRLNTDAVPTIFLVTAGSKPVSTKAIESDVPNEPLQLNETKTTTRSQAPATKRQLAEDRTCHTLNKIVKIQELPHHLTVFIEDDDDEDDENEALFIKDGEFTSIPKSERLEELPQKQKYTFAFKMLALQLYFKSPSSYRLLHKAINLPRISTLYRLYIPTSPQLNPHVLMALKMKVDNMTHAEKQCVVCIGTLSLTPNIQYDVKTGKLTGLHEVNYVNLLQPARTALVVAVRGLFYNWKQAIAFSFLSNGQNCSQVKLFIHFIIAELLRLGLHVRALMTDLKSDEDIGARTLTTTANNPMIYVNNTKVYYMYDPLYLIKDIRDQLMQHNFVFQTGMTASWCDIAECHREDCKRDILRLAPKLSFNLSHPSTFSFDEIKVTSEVFSKTTAAAIDAYIHMGVLHPSARGTQKWIMIMNKLMEMLNFSILNPPFNSYALFSGEKAQVDYLRSVLLLFRQLRIAKQNGSKIDVKETNNAKFIKGFKATITALLALYEDLSFEKCWHPIVGLSRDCLTDFFTKVRKKYDLYPTAEQLTTCIKTMPIFNIFQYKVKKKYSNDLESFLSYVRQVPDITKYEERLPKIGFVDLCGNDSEEFDAVELLTVSKLDHIALYLLNKAYQRHSDCDQMRIFACGDDALKENMLKYGYVTEDGHVINSIKPEFKEFISELENKFLDKFKRDSNVPSMSELIESVELVGFILPCKCFPLIYIKQLYLRFRLYLLLKHNNTLLKDVNRNVFEINYL